MFKLIKKNQKGVSLIEMMIAVYILVTGILAGVYLSMVNYISLNVSEKNFTAVNLAREAIEVIRNKRDENWLKGLPWNTGIMDDPSAYRKIISFHVSGWTIDDAYEELSECYSCRLLYHENTGLMDYDNRNMPAIDTPYKRLVKLRQICWSDDSRSEVILGEGESCDLNPELSWVGLDIRAQILWSAAGRTGTVDLEDRLYNWR